MANEHRRLSFRIRDELVAKMASGSISPGSKLPPEPELAEELGVSRSTLREALRSLEDDGFVTRTSGAGTYATRRPRARNNLDVNFGVTEAIRAAGMRPGTERSAIGTWAATHEQAAALDLTVGEPIIALERVRTADERPVVWSTDIVAAATLLAADVAAMPLDGSLYEILERLGHPVAHGVVTVTPERADRSMARRLDVKTGDLLLRLHQIDYGVDGEPLLLSEEHHVASAFEFSVVRRGPGRKAR